MFLSSNSCFCVPSSCAVSFKDTLIAASTGSSDVFEAAPGPVRARNLAKHQAKALTGSSHNENSLSHSTKRTSSQSAGDFKISSSKVATVTESKKTIINSEAEPVAVKAASKASRKDSRKASSRAAHKSRKNKRAVKDAYLFDFITGGDESPPEPTRSSPAVAIAAISPTIAALSRTEDDSVQRLSVAGIEPSSAVHLRSKSKRHIRARPSASTVYHIPVSNPFDLLFEMGEMDAEQTVASPVGPSNEDVVAFMAGKLVYMDYEGAVVGADDSFTSSDIEEELLIDSLEEYGCFVEEGFAGKQMQVLNKTSGKPVRFTEVIGRRAAAKRQRSLALERASKATTLARDGARDSKEARLDSSLPSPLAPETALFPLPCSPKAAAPAAMAVLSSLPVKVQRTDVEDFYAGCVVLKPEVQALSPMRLSVNRFSLLANEPADMELPEPAEEQAASNEEDCSSEGLFWRTLRVVGGIIARGAAVAVTVCRAVKRFFCWGQ